MATVVVAMARVSTVATAASAAGSGVAVVVAEAVKIRRLQCSSHRRHTQSDRVARS